MDVTMLATDLTSAIAPFVPFLVQMGQRSAEEAGRRLGEDAWEQAKALWARLAGRLEERPAAIETVREVAETPDDADVRAALEVQLRRVLAADAVLAEEVSRLLADWPARPGPTTVAAAGGERAIAVGGDVRHSILRTGDEVPNSD
jgi:hypothetical protein